MMSFRMSFLMYALAAVALITVLLSINKACTNVLYHEEQYKVFLLKNGIDASIFDIHLSQITCEIDGKKGTVVGFKGSAADGKNIIMGMCCTNTMDCNINKERERRNVKL